MKWKHIPCIAGFAASFTVYQQSALLLNSATSWLKNPIAADYNASHCLFFNITAHTHLTTPLSNNSDEANSIFTAVSLVPNTVDCLVTAVASPLYYMSYVVPSSWTDDNHPLLQAQFYAGAIITAGVSIASFSGLYYLPEMLSDPFFNLNPSSVCFFNKMAKVLAWTMLPLSVKTWLEQFLFSGGLIKNTWMPSVTASALSLVFYDALKDTGMPYYYMMVPCGVELSVLLSHIFTYCFNPQIKQARIYQCVPLHRIKSQIFILLKGLYAIGLTVGIELAMQIVPVYLANQLGGAIPEGVLKSQQNFYLVYMWQVATSVEQSIQVFNAKAAQDKKRVAKEVFCEGGIAGLVLIVGSFAFNYFRSERTAIDLLSYGLGATYGGSEFMRSQCACIVKALDHNILAFIITASTLSLGGIGQWCFVTYATSDISDEQAVFGLLGIQCLASMAASGVTALTAGGLFARLHKRKAAKLPLLDPVSSPAGSVHV